MKGHSAPIQPTNNLDTSAKTLNTQANLKCSKVDKSFTMTSFETISLGQTHQQHLV